MRCKNRKNCMLAVNLTVASLISTRVSLSPIFSSRMKLANSKFSHFCVPVLIQMPTLNAKDVIYSKSAAPFLAIDSTWHEFMSSEYTNTNRFENIVHSEEHYYKLDGCIFQGISGDTACLQVNAEYSRLQIRCSLFNDCSAQVMNIHCKEIYLEQVFTSGCDHQNYLFQFRPTHVCKVQYNSWNGVENQFGFMTVTNRKPSLQNSNTTSTNLAVSGIKSASGIGVKLCTFAAITATESFLFESTSADVIDTCNFIDVTAWIFKQKPTLMKSYFSGTVHLLQREETPVGWEDALIPVECVFVEALSRVVGVGEGGSSRYGASEATQVAISMKNQHSCVPDPTSYIPTPSASESPAATPNPLEPTRTPTPSPVETRSPSASESPSATQTPKATPDVPKILTITVPSGVAAIVIPVFLYFCIRMIQDAVSAGDYQHGEVLAYVSDESVESGDRENAMWMDDDDSDFGDDDEKDFFKSKVIRNPRDVFSSEQSYNEDDESSSF